MNLKELLKKLQAEMKPLSVKADLSDAEAERLTKLMAEEAKTSQQIDAQEIAAKAEAKEIEAVEKAAEERQAEIDAEVEKQVTDYKAKAAEGRRLPDGVPGQAKYGNTWRYDNLTPGEHAFMNGILQSHNKPVSEDSLKALAIKIVEGENGEGELNRSLQAMKMVGMPMKSTELNRTDLSSYGDEWIGITYSTDLWEKIRQDTPILGKIPTIEVPQGSESIIIPLQSDPPTFYKVAQATAQGTNPGAITRTVTTSKMGTANVTLAVEKLGAATYFTGELVEDSLIPWMSELSRSIVQEGTEVLEHIVIDGDTAGGASVNINDIADTPGGKEAFLLFDGFRKAPLVTTTANSRDGGALAVEDFTETLKMMGIAGKNAIQKDKVGFILDLWTNWKVLELAEVKTRDVFVAPTIEKGVLTAIYGYDVYTSAQMHRANTDTTYGLKANTAGKIDLDTASNNTKGAILAVRWDQWRLGWKRRMTIETTRVPSADSTEIVALMRVGLIQRDTEASAISYNIGV